MSAGNTQTNPEPPNLTVIRMATGPRENLAPLRR